jgi:hypothetical protein
MGTLATGHPLSQVIRKSLNLLISWRAKLDQPSAKSQLPLPDNLSDGIREKLDDDRRT